MKPLRFFDSHCDTAYELYHRGVGLDENNCHVSLSNATPYSQYAQYYAVWSNRRLDDEACWQDFLRIAEYFDRDIERLADRVTRVRTGNELTTALGQGKHAAILAVEDARLIAGDLARLDILHGMGVRYLTLLWGGNSCIGGSHDTEDGLTELGKQTVRRCFELGIIPDVSHASEKSTDDILNIAAQYGKPVIASHSNAYSVYAHSRNLRDRHFDTIRSLGGTVGVSLCRSHLTSHKEHPATPEHVFAHVDYYLSRGGEDVVGFGADWDGTDLPDGMEHLGAMPLVAEIMARHNYSDELIDKIFFGNAYDFAIKNLK